MSENYRMEETEESLERTTDGRSGRGWAIAGIVCGALALLIAPPLLGLAGIVFGIVGRVKGAGTLSIVAIVVSVVGAVAGLIFGAFIANLAAGVGG